MPGGAASGTICHQTYSCAQLATAAWQPDECIFHETRAERADLVDWTIRLDHEGNLPQISHFSAE